MAPRGPRRSGFSFARRRDNDERTLDSASRAAQCAIARRECVSPTITMTYPTALILQAIANGYRHGFDIMEITGLPSGTVYPALRRLERAEAVSSRWEDAEIAQGEQRPARRYYELTASGEAALERAVSRYRLLGGPMPDAGNARRPARG